MWDFKIDALMMLHYLKDVLKLTLYTLLDVLTLNSYHKMNDK
jgi:hypothetical protein